MISINLCLATALRVSPAQNYELEMFERHFMARTAQEFTLRTAYAEAMPFEARNREDLYNRFFQIDSVMNAVPVLIASGMNLVLQAVVGYVVVSFYHPYFLFVSAVHALLLGVGGWLVVSGELTVGQLLAAELILGTIFLNMGALPTVLESWYGMRAALDRRSTFQVWTPPWSRTGVRPASCSRAGRGKPSAPWAVSSSAWSRWCRPTVAFVSCWRLTPTSRPGRLSAICASALRREAGSCSTRCRSAMNSGGD